MTEGKRPLKTCNGVSYVEETGFGESGGWEKVRTGGIRGGTGKSRGAMEQTRLAADFLSLRRAEGEGMSSRGPRRAESRSQDR